MLKVNADYSALYIIRVSSDERCKIQSLTKLQYFQIIDIISAKFMFWNSIKMKCIRTQHMRCTWNKNLQRHASQIPFYKTTIDITIFSDQNQNMAVPPWPTQITNQCKASTEKIKEK